MKMFNTSKGIIHFPLATGQRVETGKIYEIVNGKAQKVTDISTGNILGACAGGDEIRDGYIMLDIDPTSVFEERYTTEQPPHFGVYINNCKLVIAVDTSRKTFKYLIRNRLDTSEDEQIMSVLNNIMDSTDEDEGYGGTDEQIIAVLDSVWE